MWKEGLADWMPASQLEELNDLFATDSTQPPPIAVPYTNPLPMAPPKNWLIESIIVTLLCCLPLGIVGIIHATKVDSLWASGQRDAALKASQEAGKWVKLGAIIGFVVIVLYILVMFFSVFASFASGMEV